MELQKEWTRRLERWMQALVKDVYHPIGNVEFEGFSTFDRLSYDEAMKGDFKPMKQGDRWGRMWEYMWLRGKITLPESAEGKRIVMRLNPGGESSIYVNGNEFGTRRNDWVRDPIHLISDETLTECGKAGDTYELVLEAYAGHDDTGCDYGPVLPGTYNPRGEDEIRTSLGESTFGVWNELAYQLYMDVKVLWEAWHQLTPQGLRCQDVWQGLKDFTTIVDFEQPEDVRNASYAAARERLKPLFECHNGSTAPQFYAFGHAHIDIAWLWPIAETERKVLRTFAAQIRHMDAYPEYKFLQSQPHLYRMCKQMYPKLYEKIKQKVKEGQWIPEGATWVECDTNITGGEAMIRQFLHGKRFFKEEFGIDSKMFWLPDTFGYTAALPQIMKGCGVDYFSTQKLWWNYNGGQTFPYNYFNWVGLDGTSVETFIHDDYNSDIHAGTVISKWKNRKQVQNIRGFLAPYGYGDGGGGPARDFMEYIRRENDFEGCPKVKNAHPLDFFHEHPAPVESYVGELYLQCHRGVQTSQAKTKKGNRKSELALREAEFWGVVAKLAGYDYPLDEMDELWKKILLNQFHDILPGSSINRVYKQAEALYESVLSDVAAIRTQMNAKLAAGDEAVTVYNSLSFDRTAVIELPAGYEGAEAGGKALPVQKLGDTYIAEVQVPACGTVTVRPAAPVTLEKGACASVTANGAVLENEKLKVVFDKKGEISSILEKETGRELAAGTCNQMKMFKDIPVSFEAWDVDTTYEHCPVALEEPASFELVSEGPVKAVIRVTRKINKSELSQLISLRRNSARVDFDTTVQWHELHKMLKVGFPVNYYAEEAVHEIQFGHVRRPNHRSNQFDFDRFEVANHKWTALREEGRGFAVLNDCKYGVNVLGNCINLTLLRSPFSPDPEADQGEQKFVYSFYAYTGSFMDSGVVQEGYDLNVPAQVLPGARKDGSLLTIEAGSVILETLKPAEDGSGDYILRMYESMRTATDTVLHLHLPCASISACNMLEEDEQPLTAEKTADGCAVELHFRPFEIKTLRVHP